MIKPLDFDESIFDPIIHSQAYFDTVVFRISNLAYAEHFCRFNLLDELREINAPGSVTLQKFPMRKGVGTRWSDYVLDIKQPTRDTLLHLRRKVWEFLPARNRKEEPPLLIKRVDIALDHILDNQEDADRFALFMAQSSIQRHNMELIDTYDETVYSKQSKIKRGRKTQADRVNVIYSTKGARFYHDAPCCHQEVRYTTSTSVQRQGIFTVDDLLRFDFRNFFMKELCLIWLREDAVDRLVRKMWGISKRKKEVSYERIYNLGGKTITVDLFQRYRGRLLEHSTAWVGKNKVVSAHNLKCIANEMAADGKGRRGVFDVGHFEEVPLDRLLELDDPMDDL